MHVYPDVVVVEEKVVAPKSPVFPAVAGVGLVPIRAVPAIRSARHVCVVLKLPNC